MSILWTCYNCCTSKRIRSTQVLSASNSFETTPTVSEKVNEKQSQSQSESPSHSESVKKPRLRSSVIRLIYANRMMKTLKKSKSSRSLDTFSEEKQSERLDTVEIDDDTTNSPISITSARTKIFDSGEVFEGGYNAAGHDDEWEEIRKEFHAKKNLKLNNKESQDDDEHENDGRPGDGDNNNSSSDSNSDSDGDSDGDSDAASISSAEEEADY